MWRQGTQSDRPKRFIQTVRQIGAGETVKAFDVGQRKLAYKS
jgi:hypothetical protein